MTTHQTISKSLEMSDNDKDQINPRTYKISYNRVLKILLKIVAKMNHSGRVLKVILKNIGHMNPVLRKY